MSAVSRESSFALLVRRHPYQQRSARAELDVALAALTMDYRVDVFFIGTAILQLVEDRDTIPSRLPAAYRGWGSLPDLGEVALFAELAWLDRLTQLGSRLVVPVQGLAAAQMKQRWRRCAHAMML